MASVLPESCDKVDFNNLEEELNYLKQLTSITDISPEFHKNKRTTIKFHLRKSLLMHIYLPNTYPFNAATSVIKLITADLSNLKYTRKTVIEQFIEKFNNELETFISMNLDNYFIIKCCRLVEVGLLDSDEFTKQSFDVLENQSMKSIICDVEKDEEIKQLNNKAKKVDLALNETTSRTDKFKGSDFIFQRFKWDPNIDKSQIIIGYLDRFTGIKEIAFSEFKGVHEDRDGIPQHRIRYFKISEKIVWDRENRIDLLTKSGDVTHFFQNNGTQELTKIESLDTEKAIADDNNVTSVYKFTASDWNLQVDQVEEAQFLHGFKILTFNVMSRNNFKRSIAETMKCAKNSKGLDCYLYDIDRVSKIIESIATSSPDFILLQECEKYEEAKLKSHPFIRQTYFILSTHNESHCVILSKLRPNWTKSLKLCAESNKRALCAKFSFRTTSLNVCKELIICDIHLTSGKAANFFAKRKGQLNALRNYFSDAIGDLKSDFTIIGGDFNFGDQEDEKAGENLLVEKLFLNEGFLDLAPGLCTFDPSQNYSASITSKKLFPRRLDRILLKSNSTAGSYSVTETSLTNTSPFEIHLEPHKSITHESYTNIIKSPELDQHKFYLHPSDHYGLEVTFKFLHSLHEANLTYTNTLAILLPKHTADLVQEIRQQHDPQFERWPPHINLVYPFFDLEQNEIDQDTVVADLFDVLAQFVAFECSLDSIETFSKVVYLKPNSNATDKLSDIFQAITQGLFKHVKNRWKPKLEPHCTIAQPLDKRNVTKNWLKTTLETIKQSLIKVQATYANFDIDCIHWLQRTGTKPFEIKFSFPLGKRYPSIIHNLNPIEFTDQKSLLSYMTSKNLILSKQEDEKITELYQKIGSIIKKTKDLDFQLFDFGSYQLGINCGDFDFSLIRKKDEMVSSKEFVTSLCHELAQNSEVFHVVRDVEAIVPIIELQLNGESIRSVDLQINELNQKQLNAVDSLKSNGLYSFMWGLSGVLEYRELFVVSGIFENSNTKKYIADYKSYQILITFIKHWAKCRHIYGKAFGYLSGCSWSLMLIYFLNKNVYNRHEFDNSSGRFEVLLKEFFKFYADFNWHQPVSLLDLQHVSESSGRFQTRKPMIILQSVFPYHNTARNVQDKFKKVIINEIKLASNKLAKTSFDNCSFNNGLCKPLLLGDFPMYLKFKFELNNLDGLSHLFMLVKANVQGLVNSLRKVLNGNIRPFCQFDEVENDIQGDFMHSTFYYVGLDIEEDLKESFVVKCCHEFIEAIRKLSHVSEFKTTFETCLK